MYDWILDFRGWMADGSKRCFFIPQMTGYSCHLVRQCQGIDSVKKADGTAPCPNGTMCFYHTSHCLDSFFFFFFSWYSRYIPELKNTQSTFIWPPFFSSGMFLKTTNTHKLLAVFVFLQCRKTNIFLPDIYSICFIFHFASWGLILLR